MSKKGKKSDSPKPRGRPKKVKPVKTPVDVVVYDAMPEGFRTWWEKPNGKLTPPTKAMFEDLTDDSKALFIRLYAWEEANEATYTATLTSDVKSSSQYTLTEVDGKKTFSINGYNDDEVRSYLDTVFAGAIASITATMKKDGSIREVGVQPPSPYADDPLKDPFYADEVDDE